ncbi:MAG: flagellar motor switch protein FliN [Thermodesulfobacteriota bacterium]
MSEDLSQPAAAPVPEEEHRSIDLLLDVPLSVTVELGRARMPVRQLLALGAGAVVELTKAAGEPLDVLINGKPVARGEAVMVNDRFGVRLTEVVSPSERVERMR